MGLALQGVFHDAGVSALAKHLEMLGSGADCTRLIYDFANLGPQVPQSDLDSSADSLAERIIRAEVAASKTVAMAIVRALCHIRDNRQEKA